MNANDMLRNYNCSDNYHKYNFGMLLTDGALLRWSNFSGQLTCVN